MNNLSNVTPIVVAISGGGRSLENLLKYQTNYKIVGIITSTIHCKGMSVARNNNLPIFAADFKFGGKDLENNLSQWLEQLQVQWIVLGGFLKKFPTLKIFSNKIINIHPALLPNYGGKGMYGNRVHQAVVAAKEKTSGATVHFLDENYDEGKIISQIIVNVDTIDNAETLAKKVFAAECKLLPHTIENLIAGVLPFKSEIEVINYEP